MGFDRGVAARPGARPAGVLAVLFPLALTLPLTLTLAVRQLCISRGEKAAGKNIISLAKDVSN